MESISPKLDSTLARKIDSCMKEFHYSTKTEFIREAIRSKLKDLSQEREKEKAWKALFAARGSLKGQGRFKTDNEFYAWKSNPETQKELLAYLEKTATPNPK